LKGSLIIGRIENKNEGRGEGLTKISAKLSAIERDNETIVPRVIFKDASAAEDW
jgi:hypothetical protein